MEPKHPAAPTRLSFKQAFRPFLITLAFSLVFLAWDYNRRHGPQTFFDARVRIEGGPVVPHSARLVERPLLEWLSVPVGWREVKVSAPDTDPLLTNVFVWYGKNELGVVDLDRSRGKVEFLVSPRPLQYFLKHASTRYRTPTGFFSNIPVGDYEAVFEYSAGITEVRPVQVVGNSRQTIAITNPVGSVEISAVGLGGEYVLEAMAGSLKWRGTLPLVVPHLPSGPYRLTAHRGEYRLEREIVVLPGETNRTEIEFAYGTLEVETTPRGAVVELAGKPAGSTPVAIPDLIPGRYALRIRKDGFDPVDVEVRVRGKVTERLKQTLVLTRYREAMDLAMRARERGRFGEAERALEEALSAVPGDDRATALLRPTQAAALRERAAEFVRRGNLQEAREALSQSEAIEPGAPELVRLRGEISKIEERRVREEQEARERRVAEAARQKAADLENAIAGGKSAVANGNIERARERLSAVRSLEASHPEIPEIEASIAALQAKLDAESARRQLEEQIASRRRELAQAMDQAVNREEYRPVRTLAWRTTKSARQVEFACEPKEGKGMDVYDLYSPRDYLITWRNGRTIPIIGTGTYLRFGAVTVAPGQTEVHAYLYSLVLGTDGRPGSDPNSERNAARAQSIHESLKKALGGDLEPLTP